jgi:hypothetical protein
VAERHGNEVIVFELDHRGARLLDKLQFGPIVSQGKYQTYRREPGEAMSDEPVAMVTANGKRMIAMPIGPSVVMYHEELLIPATVLLLERKH